ncbi:uncharacterized protein LOC131217455 [Magnolia sinica]|uniref:uncharacterized protein LOC131217455 n=1 Tax=Magnolia sinica TaxID=86752 RepID=UPI002658B293|nr:uncharacterized protein LOC131217455 [Magnolia sinica]
MECKEFDKQENCLPVIFFSDDDLICDAEHNRPLMIEGHIRGKKSNYTVPLPYVERNKPFLVAPGRFQEKREKFQGLGAESSVNMVTTEQLSEEDLKIVEHPAMAPKQMEDRGQLTIDSLQEINLGTEEEPRNTFVSVGLSEQEFEKYVQLLKENKDVFAWTYAEMLVMPFGLKIARATYQRAMQNIIQDMKHKHVECYVDDLVVRSGDHQEHREHLASVFHRLRKKQLKMNPTKCAFGMSSGKFLGFVN